VVETLAVKLGTVALVLGGVHLVNVWVFNRFRRRRMDERNLRGKRPSTIQVEPAPPLT
jgi:hypothetical protein